MPDLFPYLLGPWASLGILASLTAAMIMAGETKELRLNGGMGSVRLIQ